MTIISVYLTARDTSHLDETIAKLKRAGSTRALCMISGPNDWNIDPVRFGMVCVQLRAQGIEPVAVAFPHVNGNMTGAQAHYLTCKKLAGSGQFDAEPKQVGKDPEGRPVMRHWTPGLLQPWLVADEAMTLTSTRVEVGRFASMRATGRRLYLQLEQQTSTKTLAKALEIATVEGWTLTAVVPVLGDFDQPGDPRTLPEFLADCEAVKPQATLAGEVAVWSATSMSDAEADVLRATFGG